MGRSRARLGRLREPVYGSAGSLMTQSRAGKVMAKRPSWTGFLKLSLVTCPVQLFNATTRADSVSFHFIHPKTRNRIQMKPFDPDLGEVVRKENKAALARLVLSYREHVVALAARGKGLVLHRLHDAREVETKLPFDDIKSVKVDSKMVEIASEIIAQK